MHAASRNSVWRLDKRLCITEACATVIPCGVTVFMLTPVYLVTDTEHINAATFATVPKVMPDDERVGKLPSVTHGKQALGLPGWGA